MNKWFLLFCPPIVLLLLTMMIDSYGQREHDTKQYDAIIVAGCKVKADGSPSLALQARVRKAVALYKDGYAKKIVFTGGSQDQRPTEAAAAKQYAQSIYAIPEEAILLEGSSTSTKENAAFSKKLYPNLKKVALVSDSYHIFRGERIFAKHFEHVDGYGRVPAWNVRYYGALREIAAITFYGLKGEL